MLWRKEMHQIMWAGHVCRKILFCKITHYNIPLMGPWECHFTGMLTDAVEVRWGIGSMVKECKMSQRKEVRSRDILESIVVTVKDREAWKQLWVEMEMKIHVGETSKERRRNSLALAGQGTNSKCLDFPSVQFWAWVTMRMNGLLTQMQK